MRVDEWRYARCSARPRLPAGFSQPRRNSAILSWIKADRAGQVELLRPFRLRAQLQTARANARAFAQSSAPSDPFDWPPGYPVVAFINGGSANTDGPELIILT